MLKNSSRITYEKTAVKMGIRFVNIPVLLTPISFVDIAKKTKAREEHRTASASSELISSKSGLTAIKSGNSNTKKNGIK